MLPIIHSGTIGKYSERNNNEEKGKKFRKHIERVESL
jgi:hypothetical protein